MTTGRPRGGAGLGSRVTQPLAVGRGNDGRKLILGDAGIGDDFIVPVEGMFIVHAVVLAADLSITHWPVRW